MIARQGQVYMSLPSTFDQHFQVLLTRWEQKQREHQGPKQMRTFNETLKGKKVKDKGKSESASAPGKPSGTAGG